MLAIEYMMLFGLIGGMIRLLIGYSKVYGMIGYHPPVDRKRAFLTVIVSLIAGAVTPILINSENPSVALIAGFAGIDLMEALAKGLMRLKTGYSTGFPKSSYSEFGGKKYKSELSDSQDNAISYIQKNKKITAQDYAKLNNVSLTTAYYNLRKLARLGIVTKHRKGRKVYFTLK